jgi:transglutaminase-like putative cysteine protease
VGCEFVHRLDAPAHAVLQVEPRIDGGFTLLTEEWTPEPALTSRRYLDGFGNLCRRLTIPAGRSVLKYNALVQTDRSVDPSDLTARQLNADELPDDVLEFTLPSRLCPSDEIADQAWELFGALDPGWGRVQAISDWVHNEVTFGYGSSSRVTTAADVLKSRAGVCRDFAHLFIACCRAVGVPARYAFGYLPDIDVPPVDVAMDFCAWAEVYLGDRWWTFDPRNNQQRIGRVLIGRGRDAVDVAMVTSFGTAELETMTVWADEVPA